MFGRDARGVDRDTEPIVDSVERLVMCGRQSATSDQTDQRFVCSFHAGLVCQDCGAEALEIILTRMAE